MWYTQNIVAFQMINYSDKFQDFVILNHKQGKSLYDQIIKIEPLFFIIEYPVYYNKK